MAKKRNATIETNAKVDQAFIVVFCKHFNKDTSKEITELNEWVYKDRKGKSYHITSFQQELNEGLGPTIYPYANKGSKDE